MMHKSGLIGAVILAAGSSSRLGQPKQLISIKGMPMLERTIRAIVGNESLGPVVVVLGANDKLIREQLNKMPLMESRLDLLTNPDWALGMGSSISTGVGYLIENHPTLEHILISVCDQPYLESNVIQQIVATSNEFPDRIVASSYCGTVGPPVLFPGSYFAELRELTGKSGAKQLLIQYFENVVSIPFSRGEIDIDTDEDLNTV